MTPGYRERIRQRYAELEQQHQQAAARHADLVTSQPVINNGTPNSSTPCP